MPRRDPPWDLVGLVSPELARSRKRRRQGGLQAGGIPGGCAGGTLPGLAPCQGLLGSSVGCGEVLGGRCAALAELPTLRLLGLCGLLVIRLHASSSCQSLWSGLGLKRQGLPSAVVLPSRCLAWLQRCLLYHSSARRPQQSTGSEQASLGMPGSHRKPWKPLLWCQMQKDQSKET